MRRRFPRVSASNFVNENTFFLLSKAIKYSAGEKGVGNYKSHARNQKQEFEVLDFEMPPYKAPACGPLFISYPVRGARKQCGHAQKRKDDVAAQANSGGFKPCSFAKRLTFPYNNLWGRETKEGSSNP